MTLNSIISPSHFDAVLQPSSLISLVGIWVVYRLLVVLYNVSPFHPLARFPGPKLAAATYLYEIYYDWWLVGRYTREIRGMHDRYGPIVRINPDELHCSDPRFADEIYASGGRIRDKWPHQVHIASAGPAGVSGLSTVPHELHRMRRGAVSKFFSKQQVQKLEEEILDFAQQVVAKMLRSAGKGPFSIKDAFNCFTGDVVSQYTFGEAMGFISQEAWVPNLATRAQSLLNTSFLMRHFSLVRGLANLGPMFADYLGEDAKQLARWSEETIPELITASLNNPEDGRVFEDLVKSKTLPDSEKALHRLAGEGLLFLLAGTETTTSVLCFITYQLLARPAIYARLMEDLDGIDPSKPKWAELERRPFLWAVIHEALRQMPGITQRSARIARNEDLVYRSRDGSVEMVIPHGTPVGMSSIINHWDQEIFPDPDKFNPDRWLVDGQPNYKLQQMMITFSRGSRICLGKELAYCEVFIMTTLLAFQVIPRASLHNTTIDNVTYDHDLVVLQTKKGSMTVDIAIT